MTDNVGVVEESLSGVYAEVNNLRSVYFGEEFTLTHKIVVGGEGGDEWYRAQVPYQVCKMDDVHVWFKLSELVFL